jgi:hypothetical protein
MGKTQVHAGDVLPGDLVQEPDVLAAEGVEACVRRDGQRWSEMVWEMFMVQR